MLASSGVEVGRFKPALEAGALCRPFVIEQRIPGGVTVAAFVDDGLAEGAFIGEAEAFSGTAAGRVQAVAFPFVAAVVQFVKDVVHQQVLGFGGKARAFEGVAIADPADFDDAVGRVDAHQRQGAQRRAACGVTDGEVVGVIGCGHALHVGIMCGAVGRRVNAEVGEVCRRRGGAIDGVKVIAVAGGIEFFEAAVAAVQGGDGRTCARGVTGQGVADGLVMLVGGHGSVDGVRVGSDASGVRGRVKDRGCGVDAAKREVNNVLVYRYATPSPQTEKAFSVVGIKNFSSVRGYVYTLKGKGLGKPIETL